MSSTLNIYSYRDLKDAMNELSEEHLDKPVLIFDPFRESDVEESVFFVEYTDLKDKIQNCEREVFNNESIPIGQPVLVLAADSLLEASQVINRWGKTRIGEKSK